jgi:hypothetical protein
LEQNNNTNKKKGIIEKLYLKTLISNQKIVLHVHACSHQSCACMNIYSEKEKKLA